MNLIPEAQADFGVFLGVLWPDLRMDPHPIQYRAANWIQDTPDGRDILMAMRGFGKSFVTASEACWAWYKNPDAKVIILSAREKRAREICDLARRMIESSEVLAHLRPRDHNTLWGSTMFNVGACTYAAKDPSCAAYGMGGGITGAHADLILPDDIEIPENSNTEEWRQKILDKCKELEDLLNPGGRISFRGTPQTTQSVYFKLAREMGYRLIRIPAEYPDPEEERATEYLADWLKDDLESGRKQPGDVVYPERWGREALAVKKAKQGPSHYALQMLLDPNMSDADKYPLKLRDLIVFGINPEIGPERIIWGTSDPRRDIIPVGLPKDQFYSPIFVSRDKFHPYERSVMYVDPSGTGSDETGYAVAKSLHGMVFVPAAGGLDGGYSEVALRKLGHIVMENDVREVFVESNFGDSMFTKMLERAFAEMGLKVAVTSIPSKGQKELRILETLEPAMASHRVVIDEMVAKDEKLMKQLTHLSRERGCLRHDDRIEAFAGAVGIFKDQLVVDSEKAARENLEKEVEMEVKAWEKYAKRQKPTTKIGPPLWARPSSKRFPRKS